ncbi:hypothetical protein DL766_010475 [Monosporascus sp. MC13-8B]|nr:hypothetical protein DL763_000835 [Monosporascus cannonballus]RYP02267.1 hypothetical protein DL766_010475 [Monosporascus sp. MC13-8B]
MAPISGTAQGCQMVDLVLATSKSILQIAKLLKGRQTSRELKKFYGHLMVHCIFVSDHVNRIRSALGPDNELIVRILDVFESLIASKATYGEATHMHPRQHALNKHRDSLRHQSIDVKLEYAEQCLKVGQPPELRFGQGFDESFDMWEEDVIAKYPKDGSQWSMDDRPPPNKRRAEPSYVMCSAAQSLFKALTGSTKCECNPTHELDARLCLGTYRKPDIDDTNDFNMFLSVQQDWQEVHVHTVRDSVVRFVVNDEMHPRHKKKLDYKPMVVKKLCEQIQKMQKMASQRLEFKIEKGQLLKIRSERSSFRIDRKKKKTLPFIQTQLSSQDVATDPSRPGQQEDGDCHPRDDLSDGADPDGVDPDDIEHPFPTLVILAVMLMELYLATPFEVLARNREFEFPEETENRTRSLDVASVFNEYKREIPQNSKFYHAIGKCLNPRTWEGERGQRLNDQMLRATIYQEVVRPLEDELCDAFNYITIEELDKIAETVNAGLGQQLVPESEYEAAKFYDDEKPSEAHSRTELEMYLNWKAKCKAEYKKFIEPYLQDPPQSPVKIAVLDSGVDETHNALDTGQIKLKRNWTNKFKKAAHDRDGHGTFTPSLIVDYAPDAELYIAKFAEKRPSNPGIIAGIDGYGDLEKPLLYAHSKNVLLFAAASKSGANQDRAYPARDPHIICVHSTDSDGNRSKFSPTALTRDSNITTIGEAVQSAWPVDLCDMSANPDCVQCKSGTSYATPIAVGIAAFLLQYARLHLADKADMLRRQSKMKDVLLKIAEKTQQSISWDGYNYVVLSLFSDDLFGKDKQFIDLTLGELLKR